MDKKPSKDAVLVARGPRHIKRVYFLGKDGQVIYEFGYPNVPVILDPGHKLWVETPNSVILSGEHVITKRLRADVLFNSCNGKWIAE